MSRPLGRRVRCRGREGLDLQIRPSSSRSDASAVGFISARKFTCRVLGLPQLAMATKTYSHGIPELRRSAADRMNHLLNDRESTHVIACSELHLATSRIPVFEWPTAR